MLYQKRYNCYALYMTLKKYVCVHQCRYDPHSPAYFGQCHTKLRLFLELFCIYMYEYYDDMQYYGTMI